MYVHCCNTVRKEKRVEKKEGEKKRKKGGEKRKREKKEKKSGEKRGTGI